MFCKNKMLKYSPGADIEMLQIVVDVACFVVEFRISNFKVKCLMLICLYFVKILNFFVGQQMVDDVFDE